MTKANKITMDQTELIKLLEGIRGQLIGLGVGELELVASLVRGELKLARMCINRPFTPAQFERAQGRTWNK
jgi:hypothetical protein